MTIKHNLSSLTICAIDCINVELAIDAIKKSKSECEFKDAIIFSDACENPGNINFVKIEKIKNKDGYSRFILKDLHRYIKTSHVLIVQWDGYVVNGNQWDNKYLDYDYIGAKWDWLPEGTNIGNGGFSIRSKKLLEIIASDDFPFVSNMAEDLQICRLYRSRLEKEYSVAFPAEELAAKFSYERTLPGLPTFGFHGLSNMWRHMGDEEMLDLSKRFNPHVYRTTEYFELVLEYFLMRKFPPLIALYSNIKKHCNQNEISENFLLLTKDENFTQWFMNNF